MRRRGRVLLLLGSILAIIAAVGVYVVLQQQQPAQVTEPPITTKQILFAVEDIAAGQTVDPASVELRDFPIDSAPPDALTNAADVAGKYATTAIYADQIVLKQMVATPKELAETGSMASALVPEGLVAYPMPISELSGVSYALNSGDHVDVLIAFRFLDVDRETQVQLPVQRGGTDTVQGTQLPRITSQLTLQNIEVLRVGSWYTPPAQAPQTQQQQGQPAPTPSPPAVVTLLMKQQDALVLQFARQVRATVDLALRNPNDTLTVDTDPVTLDYMLERFNIDIPTKQINSLQTLSTGE